MQTGRTRMGSRENIPWESQNPLQSTNHRQHFKAAGELSLPCSLKDQEKMRLALPSLMFHPFRARPPSVLLLFFKPFQSSDETAPDCTTRWSSGWTLRLKMPLPNDERCFGGSHCSVGARDRFLRGQSRVRLDQLPLCIRQRGTFNGKLTSELILDGDWWIVVGSPPAAWRVQRYKTAVKPGDVEFGVLSTLRCQHRYMAWRKDEDIFQYFLSLVPNMSIVCRTSKVRGYCCWKENLPITWCTWYKCCFRLQNFYRNIKRSEQHRMHPPRLDVGWQITTRPSYEFHPRRYFPWRYHGSRHWRRRWGPSWNWIGRVSKDRRRARRPALVLALSRAARQTQTDE